MLFNYSIREGTIEVESEKELGTTFLIKIPVNS